MEREEQVTVEEILRLVAELTKVQNEKAKVSSKLFIRNGKDQIVNKVNNLKSKLMQQAEIYGQKATKVQETYNLNKETKDNILQEYQEALQEIQQQYEAQDKMYANAIDMWQGEDEKNILKECELKLKRKEIARSPEYVQQMLAEETLQKEIKKDVSKGNLDLATEKIEELKSLQSKNPLSQCDREIKEVQERRDRTENLIEMFKKRREECHEDRNEDINSAMEDRDTQLVAMKKQNLFQKVAGNIMNKLNGANRFKNNVMKVLAQKVNHIKEETIPELQEKLSDKMFDIEQKAEGLMQDTLDKGRETKEKTMQELKNFLTEKIEADRSKTEQKREVYEDNQL